MGRLVVQQLREVVKADDYNEDSDLISFLGDAADALRKQWSCDPTHPSGSLDALDAAFAAAMQALAERRHPHLEDTAADTWIGLRITAMATLIEGTVGPVAGPLPEDRTALVRRATHALRVGPPPGARWGIASSCGSAYEAAPGHPAEPNRYECGMGHVPERATRFLDFLAN
jgi:hypothetical protein